MSLDLAGLLEEDGRCLRRRDRPEEGLMEERVISVQTTSAARPITPARRPAVLAGAVEVATLSPITHCVIPACRRRVSASFPPGGPRLFYSNNLRKYSERARRLS